MHTTDKNSATYLRNSVPRIRGAFAAGGAGRGLGSRMRSPFALRVRESVPVQDRRYGTGSWRTDLIVEESNQSNHSCDCWSAHPGPRDHRTADKHHECNAGVTGVPGVRPAASHKRDYTRCSRMNL